MGQAIRTNGRPVFSSPAGEKCATAHSRPVDLVHLARQTGGDRELEEEVLQLFLRQAAALGREVEGASDYDTVAKVAHSIKGAARAVGAFDVAQLADSLEGHPSEKKCVKALVSEINSTCDYISSLLR